MLSRFTEHLLLQTNPEQFFTDAGRKRATRPGELTADDIELALAQLRQVLARPTDHRWFGELVTEPRYDIELHPKELSRARDRLHKAQAQPRAGLGAALLQAHEALQHALAVLGRDAGAAVSHRYDDRVLALGEVD